MVRSPYEWKILEGDEKHKQTNKQTILSSKDALCQVWLKFVVLDKKDKMWKVCYDDDDDDDEQRTNFKQTWAFD